jgi:putative salt-induced outer membrane protein YdiY
MGLTLHVLPYGPDVTRPQPIRTYKEPMKYSSTLFLVLIYLPAQCFAETLLTLGNGDVLRGEIKSRENGSLTFIHQVLGQITLNEEHIVSVVDDEAVYTKTATVMSESVANTLLPGTDTSRTPNSKSAEETVSGSNWDKQLDVGVSGAEGNSRSRNIHIALAAETETNNYRWDVETAYDASEENGKKSRDEFFIQANRDWLRADSPYFYFSTGRFDWNNFQDWTYRVNLASGLGKDLVQRDDWILRGKMGLGFNQEIEGEEEGISPEGLLELDSQWQLTEEHRIELKTIFYPQLDELKEYRNNTTLAWVNKLNDSMRLKIGLSNEYDSDVPRDIHKSDLKYITSLSWDL